MKNHKNIPYKKDSFLTTRETTTPPERTKNRPIVKTSNLGNNKKLSLRCFHYVFHNEIQCMLSLPVFYKKRAIL